MNERRTMWYIKSPVNCEHLVGGENNNQYDLNTQTNSFYTPYISDENEGLIIV